MTSPVIILDVDHTLVHSVKKKKTVNHEQLYIETKDYNVYLRPHIYDFLRYCFEVTPFVILWSAGTEDYISEITKYFSSDFYFYKVITRTTYDTVEKDVDLILTDQLIKNSLIIFVDDYPDRIKYNESEPLIFEIKKYTYRDNNDIELKKVKDDIKVIIGK